MVINATVAQQLATAVTAVTGLTRAVARLQEHAARDGKPHAWELSELQQALTEAVKERDRLQGLVNSEGGLTR